MYHWNDQKAWRHYRNCIQILHDVNNEIDPIETYGLRIQNVKPPAIIINDNHSITLKKVVHQTILLELNRQNNTNVPLDACIIQQRVRCRRCDDVRNVRNDKWVVHVEIDDSNRNENLAIWVLKEYQGLIRTRK